MKRETSASVNDIIAKTRDLLTGEQRQQAKEAAAETPAAPFTTPEGDALRKHAAALRNLDLSSEKRAGIRRVLDGDMPSEAQLAELQSKEAALQLNVAAGKTPADTLRNVAGQLREVGDHIKTAAHIEGFKTVRAHVAAERLKRHLNA